jgi:hypothetical protein
VGTFDGDIGEDAAAHGEGPTKDVAGWRAAAGDAFSLPWLDKVVSFTDFHEHGFAILASDFLHSFLREYGVQLQHLPPNAVS